MRRTIAVDQIDLNHCARADLQIRIDFARNRSRFTDKYQFTLANIRTKGKGNMGGR